MDDSFRLMDVARRVVDDVNQLLDHSPRRLIQENQLRESAGSITGNIREAYGRRAGAERNQFLRFARGSAEETDERLRANWRANRIRGVNYRTQHLRIAVIVKMLNVLMVDR